MANPIKGQVPLKLSDGREFTLVLDFAAMVEAESAYSKPMAQLGKDAQAGFAGAVCAIFYGALQAFHPGMTLRDATNLFGANADAVTSALAAAELKSAGPQTGEGKDGPNPPGNNSGSSGARLASTRKRSGGKPRTPST